MAGVSRGRFVFQWWDRAPDGKYLDKYDAPVGTRTPNGAVWGHSLIDFFMIQRIPGTNVVTCWSRSMINEYGERPVDDGEEEPHPPRIRRPYPLLKIDKDVECPERGMYGYFDEGCSGYCYPTPVEDPEDTNPKGKVKAEDTDAEAGVEETDRLESTSIPEGSSFESETESETQAESPSSTPEQDHIDEEEDGSIHRRLEEHIPQQFFPDRLVVTDPSWLAFGTDKIPKEDDEPERKPWTYERLYPSFPRDLSADRFAENPITAELYLDPEEVVGVGNHSNVYRATLTLPNGLSARTPDGKVTVVAKISFPDSEHRSLLRNEAKIFNSFPKHLSEDWCGYNVIRPLFLPVPVGPVVPKFYGYYMPTGENTDDLSPILLMEECGTPVNLKNLTPDEKTECNSLYLRLHLEGFLHRSTYIRNVVMQPGPLTHHPERRSWSTPSFRLIDFGRSNNVKEKVEKESKGDLTEEEIRERKARAHRSWDINRVQEESSIRREFDMWETW